jgi:hypothetical protein
VKVEDVYPDAALALFRPNSFLPPEAAEQISGLTISEVMSRVRRLESKPAKGTGYQRGKSRRENYSTPEPEGHSITYFRALGPRFRGTITFYQNFS